VDVESKEKTITGMEILSIDALKSILILKNLINGGKNNTLEKPV